MKQIFALILLIVNLQHAQANVYPHADCKAKIEQDLAEQEAVNREEDGKKMGKLKCKLVQIRTTKGSDQDCPWKLRFTYTCSPGQIKGDGGACCP